jgi:hypothetical protein
MQLLMCQYLYFSTSKEAVFTEALGHATPHVSVFVAPHVSAYLLY